MSKNIFIINGSGGTGKDTFVTFCSQQNSVLNISSVDKVKDAGKILGWKGGKTEEDRLFLADMKFLSTRYNDQPYNYIKNNINYFKRDDVPFNLMFIHIREPKEIDRVKNDFGCKTLFIRNSNVKAITSNEADANVEKYDYDFVIENNEDLESLRLKAVEFTNEVCNEKY
jgi:hypothetical protein